MGNERSASELFESDTYWLISVELIIEPILIGLILLSALLAFEVVIVWRESGAAVRVCDCLVRRARSRAWPPRVEPFSPVRPLATTTAIVVTHRDIIRLLCIKLAVRTGRIRTRLRKGRSRRGVGRFVGRLFVHVLLIVTGEGVGHIHHILVHLVELVDNDLLQSVYPALEELHDSRLMF